MPTRIRFLDKELSVDVADELEEVRGRIEGEARSGRLVRLVRHAPEGQLVWVNPAAVAYLEEVP